MTHLAPLIRDLAVILGVAGVVTLLFRRIRQPVVLGYIVAGVIVGPHTPPTPLVRDIPNIRTWAEIGVIFLMFTLGLEFSFRKLARVGISASLTAIAEVISMFAVGFGCGTLFGWSFYDRLFLGGMMAISSTTIIIKAFDELGLKSRRFAQIVFGILVAEDLAAILLLVALGTAAATSSFSGLALLAAAGKLVLVVGSWVLVGYFVIPRLIRQVGKLGNDETLTVLSLGLCLGLVVLSAHFHYSTALGAFIMGSILAESPEVHRIETVMRPLRDVFGAVFFVSVGMLIDPRAVYEHAGPVAAITLAMLVGKPLCNIVGCLLTGQSLRTATQVGFSLGQFGEFSFIIAALGSSLGVTSEFLYPVGVAVSLITTFTTPYLIRASTPVAGWLERMLPERAQRSVERYGAWVERRRADQADKRLLYRALFRWSLNGLVVTLVFAFGSAVLADWIGDRGLDPNLGWVAAGVLSLPFVWAMLTAFRGRGWVASLGGQVLTFAWVAILSLEFFSVNQALVLLALPAVSVVSRFYGRVGTSYHWIERHFLSGFGGVAEPRGPALAPWDAHLVRLKVHPSAAFAGQRLQDLQLRNRHGINVVAIQRDLRSIVAPRPQEFLFPHDEVLVLGTDDRIEAARASIENAGDGVGDLKPIEAYDLRSVALKEGSPYAGVSIRAAGIRERLGAMVVGLERGSSRMMSPDSDLPLQAGDVIWVVGEREGLDRLSHEASRGR